MTRNRELFPEPFSPTMSMFCPVLSLKDTSVAVHACSRREGKYKGKAEMEEVHTIRGGGDVIGVNGEGSEQKLQMTAFQSSYVQSWNHLSVGVLPIPEEQQRGVSHPHQYPHRFHFHHFPARYRSIPPLCHCSAVSAS